MNKKQKLEQTHRESENEQNVHFETANQIEEEYCEFFT